MTGYSGKPGLDIPTEAEMDNGIWGEFEATRRRDPEWLNEANARNRQAEYERADCCWDQVRFVCEIPRARQLSATRVVDLAPARVRLCYFHAATLEGMDSQARLYEIGASPRG